MRSRKFRFEGWVLDPESGDLERDGTRIRLQEQPVEVLQALLLAGGSIVTREQLIALLWPKGVVDFDAGLNTIIRKLRSALGDTSDTPRYIETLPGGAIASLDLSIRSRKNPPPRLPGYRRPCKATIQRPARTLPLRKFPQRLPATRRRRLCQ